MLESKFITKIPIGVRRNNLIGQVNEWAYIPVLRTLLLCLSAILPIANKKKIVIREPIEIMIPREMTFSIFR